MPTHNEKLQQIHEIIATRLQENHECLESGWKRAEQWVLLSNQEMFVELQSMMASLEQELFGGKHVQKQTEEIPDRNVSESNNPSVRENSFRTSRAGDFSC